jgi:hypothetical protein
MPPAKPGAFYCEPLKAEIMRVLKAADVVPAPVPEPEPALLHS